MIEGVILNIVQYRFRQQVARRTPARQQVPDFGGGDRQRAQLLDDNAPCRSVMQASSAGRRCDLQAIAPPPLLSVTASRGGRSPQYVPIPAVPASGASGDIQHRITAHDQAQTGSRTQLCAQLNQAVDGIGLARSRSSRVSQASAGSAATASSTMAARCCACSRAAPGAAALHRASGATAPAADAPPTPARNASGRNAPG